jgi:hypothetical protein
VFGNIAKIASSITIVIYAHSSHYHSSAIMKEKV